MPLVVGFTVTNQRSIVEENLQRRIEELRGSGYSLLAVSTAPQTVSGLPSHVLSDPFFYPPTPTSENGTDYTTYVVVHYMAADSNGTLQPANPLGGNTGRKRISATIAWQSRGVWRTQTSTSLMESKTQGTKNVEFQGSVTDAGGIPLTGAKVQVLEDFAVFALSNVTGNFQFNVRPGTYTLVATSHGYFSDLRPNCFVSYANTPATQSFSLTARDVGTIMGVVWKNDHLVISRVVSDNAGSEWVELFNPTTWTWSGADLGLTIQSVIQPTPQPIALMSVPVNNILPGHFFLMSNNASILGVPSDAVWAGDRIPSNLATGLFLDAMGGSIQDTVGWGTVGTPPLVEGVGVNSAMLPGSELFRRSNVSGSSNLIGPAYDSGSNQSDFVTNGAVVPRNSSMNQPVTAGTPADGAVIFVDDGVSLPAVAGLIGNPPEAKFVMPGVATGTWTVVGSSGTSISISSCGMISGGTVTSNLFLSTASVFGIISGQVRDAVTNLPLSAITVTPGGVTDANGYYFLSVPPGNVTVAANVGGPPPYGNATQVVTVSAGGVLRGINFLLSRAATLQGRAERSSGFGILNYPISFRGQSQAIIYETTTDSNGDYSISVPTGTYLVTASDPEGDEMSHYEFGVSGTYTSICIASIPGAVVNCGTIRSSLFPVTISGRITKTGTPIENGAVVELWQAGELLGRTTTESAGKYSIRTNAWGQNFLLYVYYDLASGSATLSLPGATTVGTVDVDLQ